MRWVRNQAKLDRVLALTPDPRSALCACAATPEPGLGGAVTRDERTVRAEA